MVLIAVSVIFSMFASGLLAGSVAAFALGRECTNDAVALAVMGLTFAIVAFGLFQGVVLP